MTRRFAPFLLALLAACGGHHAKPGTPTPAAEPGTPTPAVAPDAGAAALSGQVSPPPSAVLDTSDHHPTFDEQVTDFLRRTADSLADARALAALQDARPDSAEVDDDKAPVPGETAAAPTTWDIDVVTFNNHDRVQYYLDFFQGPGRDRMAIWLERMPRYEPMIRSEMRKRGLPEDMVYLALIESGFSNSAVSRSRAVGMWQFMKGTAKLYHLRVDRLVDERRDPYKATAAAARFLAALRDRFGSVYLAAAAYNAGPGKVGRSLRRLPDDEADAGVSSDADFFRLYDTRLIRRETKDYVPKLIAAALIAKQPGKYGFNPPAPGDSQPPDSLLVTGATGLDVIARLADTTLMAIRDLNPQYLTLMTPPGARMTIRVPRGRGEAVQAAYTALPASERVTYVEHTVASGETLGQIAKRYRVSTDMLKDANPRLKPTALRIGQRVIIPTSAQPLSPEVRRSLETPTRLGHASGAGTHLVRRGETLSGIAAHYEVSVEELQRWNNLKPGAPIAAGRRLRIGGATVSRAPATRKSGSSSSQGTAGPGGTHLVKSGETLTAVARRYGVTVTALRQANGMGPKDVLRAGSTIRIPG